jgi:hypothetical protein
MAKPPSDDVEIYPMHAVGQPMLVRKGACAKLPEITMNNECGEMHAMVLAMGKKQGLLWGNPPLRHMHMGHGFSSNPNLHWGY